MNFALIKNAVVENTIVCESAELAKELYPDFTIVEIAGIPAGIGWKYDGETFAAPEIVRTPEEVAAENLATAQSEYNRASEYITALNEQIEDADYTDTTEADVKAELTVWTEYRKQLRAYVKAGDGSKAPPVLPKSQL